MLPCPGDMVHCGVRPAISLPCASRADGLEPDHVALPRVLRGGRDVDRRHGRRHDPDPEACPVTSLPAASFAVMIASPAPTAVSRPSLRTVATLGALEVQAIGS